MVSDTVHDVNQVVHNEGMAAWVGGTMFGRLAHNPSLRRISSRAERGEPSARPPVRRALRRHGPR